MQLERGCTHRSSIKHIVAYTRNQSLRDDDDERENIKSVLRERGAYSFFYSVSDVSDIVTPERIERRENIRREEREKNTGNAFYSPFFNLAIVMVMLSVSFTGHIVSCVCVYIYLYMKKGVETCPSIVRLQSPGLHCSNF